MTRSEQLYMDRLRAIRAPKRASIGVSGSAAGAAAGAPITADQGPLPDGGNLGQSSMPNMQSGIVPGRNRMSIGNSARGNIDLGSFLSARPNQDAINQLAQNPLAQVDPYKATTGVGGFFRRLLGDDANERNEAAAGQRGQMLAQKWLIDQRNQGQLSVAEQQHKYDLERLKAASDLKNAETQYGVQLGLQGKQLENSWALQQQAEAAKRARTDKFDELTGIVGDPIQASMLQEQMLRAPLDKLVADTAEANARAQGTGGFAPRPVQGRAAPTGFKSITGNLIQDLATGSLLNFDPETGTMTPVGMGGGAPDGAPDPTKLGNLATLLKAEDEQNKVNQMMAPPSAWGGLKDLGSEAFGMATDATVKATDAAVKSPFLRYSPPILVGKAAMNAGGRVLDFLRKRDAATKNQQISNYYE